MSTSNLITHQNDTIFHSTAFAAVRRKEQAVSDEDWIKALLRRGAYGVLATLGPDDQPFLNTNNYVYDDERRCIYIHRSHVGRTSANIQHHPRVCYTVVEMGRMLAAKQMNAFNVEYRSVVIFGTAEVVEADEAQHALELLMRKYAPHLTMGVDYEPLSDDHPCRAAVYRINIEQWSGKKSEAPADHPGAYDYFAVRDVT